MAVSDTIEDWLSVVRPPVADGDLTERFCLISDRQHKQLLTISQDGQRLLHLKPSHELDARADVAMFSEAAVAELEAAPKSDGGWTSQIVAVSDTRNPDHRAPRGSISGVRGLMCDGVACALIQFEGVGENAERDRYVETIWFDADSETWRQLDIRGQSGVLFGGSVEARVHTSSAGESVIYAKTTATSGSHEDVSLIFRDRDRWRSLVARFPKSEQDYSYRLIANASEGSLGTLLRFGADAVVDSKELSIVVEPGFDPELRCEPADATQWRRTDLGGEHPDLGALSASRFIPIPGRAGSFVLLAADGRLFTVTGFDANPSVTSLDDGELRASTVRAALDHAPAYAGAARVVLICVDASPERRMWIKRERADADGEFHPWVCLGDQARALAVAEHMFDGVELFLVNDDGGGGGGGGGASVTIEHLSLDPAGESWHTEVLELGTQELADDAESTRVHSSKITLATKAGAAAGGAVVGLRSSYPCVAIVNGLARQLSPSRAIPVVADPAGQLSIKVHAESIDGPVHTLELDGETIAVRANEAVARRLSGKEKHEALDVQRLVDRGVVPKGARMDDATRRRFATMIQAAGHAMGQRGTDSGGDAVGYDIASDPDVRCFCGTVKTDAGRPSCFVAQFEGHPRARIDPDKPVTDCDLQAASFSGGFLADVVRWIKRTAQKLVAFVVKVGRGIVEFTLELADRVVKFTMRTIDGIANALEALVELVNRAIERAIDGAKRLLDLAAALFDVRSIVRTNDVLAHLLVTGLDFAKNFVANDLDKLTAKLIRGVVEQLDGALEQVKGQLGGLTVGGLMANGLPDSEGGSGVAGRRDLLNLAGVQAAWVFDRARGNADAVAGEAPAFAATASGGTLRQRIERLQALFVNHADLQDQGTLLGKCIDVCVDIAKLFETGLAGVSLVRIIEHLQDFVKLGADLLEAGVSIVLGLIGEAIGMFADLLRTELKIPGIDQLAKLVLGRSLRVADLITLGLSVAGTVLWKIIHEGKEPFDEDLHDRIINTNPLVPKTEDAALDTAGEQELDRFALYLWVQLKRFFGDDASADEKRRLVRWVEQEKSVVFHLKWISTVLSFIYYVGYFFVVIPANGARDLINMVDYGNIGATAIDVYGKVFAVGAVCIGALGVYTAAVQAATIEFAPDSDEAKLWIAQRRSDMVPPLSWFSLTWILYLVFGVTGLLCLKSFGVVGAIANLVINMTLGLALFAGSIVYLHFYLERNAGRIRPWKVAEEISKIIWAIPGLAAFMVPVVYFSKKIPKVGPAVAVVLGGIVLTVNAGIEAVCCVVHMGSLIDENMAKDWSDFSGKPPGAPSPDPQTSDIGLHPAISTG